MKRYVIYGCEQHYGGLHGIESMYVGEFNDDISEQDLNDCVTELSYEVMEMFSCWSYLNIDEFDSEDEYYETLQEEMDENLDGYWLKVRDNVTLSTKQLDEELCYLGIELFKEKYCEKGA